MNKFHVIDKYYEFYFISPDPVLQVKIIITAGIRQEIMMTELKAKILEELGVEQVNNGASIGGTDGWRRTSGPELVSFSPIDGSPIAAVRTAERADYEAVMSAAEAAFARFRTMPAPKRGEIVRRIGNRLREKKEALGTLISLETGKIKAEGLGEVQEMIDIA
ncbi:MAG: aldehyde dehydrogenase family protein, partial [Desulfobacterales bacterium]|nr:aldehyde dehydrogenase family protein [Desulfobacterales bacterium]